MARDVEVASPARSGAAERVFAVRASRRRTIMFVALGVGMCAVSVGVIAIGGSGFATAIGFAGLLLFGGFTAYTGAWIVRDAPMLIAEPEGLRLDAAHGVRTPWSALAAVQLYDYRGDRFLAIKFKDGAAPKLRTSARLIARANGRFVECDVLLPLNVMTRPGEEIIEAIAAYAEAARDDP